MSGYIGNIPTPQATQIRDVFTATAGQTSFATSGYTPGFVDVYLNGVKLVDGTDFTATNGSDVVLASGAATSDTVEVVSYSTYEVNNQAFTGDFSVDGTTFKVDSTNNRVGIGTSSPAAKLELNTTSSSFTDLILRSSTSGIGELRFGDTTANAGFIKYEHGIDYMAFATSATERMRIDSSGNVGIGTNSPAFTSGSGLEVQRAADATVRVERTDATASAGEFVASSGLVKIGSTGGVPFTFITDNTERARIDSSGKIAAGGTATNGRLTIREPGVNPASNLNNAAITTYGNFGGGIAFLDTADPNSGTGYMLWVDDSGNDFNIARGTTSSAAAGGVYINDNAGSWSSRSDERDKTNLEPITDAASKVQSLRAVIGEYIWAEGVRHPFLIAQDVQAVFPEAVSIANKSAPEEEQRLGMSYTDMVPLLTAALQEALADIATLKAEVAALKGEPA